MCVLSGFIFEELWFVSGSIAVVIFVCSEWQWFTTFYDKTSHFAVDKFDPPPTPVFGFGDMFDAAFHLQGSNMVKLFHEKSAAGRALYKFLPCPFVLNKWFFSLYVAYCAVRLIGTCWNSCLRSLAVLTWKLIILWNHLKQKKGQWWIRIIRMIFETQTPFETQRPTQIAALPAPRWWSDEGGTQPSDSWLTHFTVSSWPAEATRPQSLPCGFAALSALFGPQPGWSIWRDRFWKLHQRFWHVVALFCTGTEGLTVWVHVWSGGQPEIKQVTKRYPPVN